MRSRHPSGPLRSATPARVVAAPREFDKRFALFISVAGWHVSRTIEGDTCFHEGPALIDLWYKNAVIYSLDVGTFADGNADGVGDFRGLADRLPYLAGIGVTCVWLLPFYVSSRRDDGYDIQDYYSVDPRF